MVNVSFTFTGEGLTAKFINLSTGVPQGVTYLWNFGDNSEPSQEKDPTHTYGALGIYPVTLTLENYTPVEGDIVSYTHNAIVSDEACTTLPDTIYNLIDEYIPSEIYGDIPFIQKQLYIQKWQLYLQPLVNHCIPLDKTYNELYYEALENQLIMELAAWDWLTVRISNMLQANAEQVTVDSSTTSTTESHTSTSGSGEVKRIQTGPTEVEFFNNQEEDSKTASTVAKAIQPGGIVDLLKQKICMLSERLVIYLPICRRIDIVNAPRVVNRRRPSGLDGPDPMYPIKKGK